MQKKKTAVNDVIGCNLRSRFNSSAVDTQACTQLLISLSHMFDVILTNGHNAMHRLLDLQALGADSTRRLKITENAFQSFSVMLKSLCIE